jgi:hypothetical protein
MQAADCSTKEQVGVIEASAFREGFYSTTYHDAHKCFSPGQLSAANLADMCG